ncbi:hypothetical protein O3G_MSEX001678 [Manduca sexta]|uniref:SNRNP25 ubiquitin-like domain-containing protein n=1 Tax=Manduca sexta TaxID=7130 RepID=A0A921YKR4_MANSE|nr:hypothetical protein O3G_MSEX001678 [Manduca sexta]
MDESEVETLSHDELVELTQSSLETLFKCDSLLKDLPSDIILEEVLSQIAVEHGQSITVYVARASRSMLRVIIPQNATVKELKKAIARHFEIHQKRTNNKVKISWRYVWRTYSLCYDCLELEDNSTFIQDYGVTNQVILHFKKKKGKKK